MSRQFKQLPYFPVKAEGGRIRKGICAVFGNVDSWGDRIQPGAFTKTISEGKSRVKHLWNHGFGEPPIASIRELKEVSREELPAEVLDYAPEATGGLMVAREYYDVPFADWVLKSIDAGDITEMSFGYDVVRAQDVTEDDIKIRDLLELKLFDTSDVLWGMNQATTTIGAKSTMPLGVVAQQFLFHAEEIKAGRRNADSDMQLIKSIHSSIVSLGYDECMEKTDEGKAETVASDISLLANRLNLAKTRNLTLEKI